MPTGRYVCDLEPGDDLGAIEFDLTPLFVREFCHSSEMHQPEFQNGDGTEGSGSAGYAPPTVAHMAKMKLFQQACPEGSGPDARMHYTFQIEWFKPMRIGMRVRVSGRCQNRYEKREREYITFQLDIDDAHTKERLLRYDDITLVSFRRKSERTDQTTSERPSGAA